MFFRFAALENPVASPNSTIQISGVIEKNGYNVTVAVVECYVGFQLLKNVSWIFEPAFGLWQWVEYNPMANVSDVVCQLLEGKLQDVLYNVCGY